MLIMALVISFNLIIVLYKFKKERYFDAVIDGGLLIGVASLTTISTIALFAGAIGSFIVSLYLLMSPPRIGL
jgi:hypothetical protein